MKTALYSGGPKFIYIYNENSIVGEFIKERMESGKSY